MVKNHSLKVMYVFSLMLIGLGCSGSAPTVGDEIPFLAAGGVAVLWVFETEDCLSCSQIDLDVREVQRAVNPSPVEVIAVHVGHARDSSIIIGSLRNKRLDARRVDISRTELRRNFGRVKLPATFVLDADTVRWLRSPEYRSPLSAGEAMQYERVRNLRD